MTVPPTPTQIKQAKRAAKEAALAAKQLALPDRRYGVIVADPPWRWEPYSRETGMDRAAENHYPTSGVEEIAALAVLNIPADDCVLFLWATVPCLEYALMVMKAWGFIYKSQAVWVWLLVPKQA
jgi:N6-adenosine-specific RNA methylase IME4